MFFKFLKPEKSLKSPPGDLVERVEALERGLRSLKLEWEDVLDRVTRIMGRLNARMRATVAAADAQEAAQSTNEDRAGENHGFDYIEAQRELARRKRDGVLRRGG